MCVSKDNKIQDSSATAIRSHDHKVRGTLERHDAHSYQDSLAGRSTFSRRWLPARRQGNSLLEVMAATVCASMLLVPTATMLSDAGRWSSRMEQQSELISLTNSCVADVEFQLASNFRSGQLQDSFTSRGFPNSRYLTTFSDAVANGGIPNRFMVIQVLTWVDLNGNAIWDAGEPKQELTTGVARRG